MDIYITIQTNNMCSLPTSWKLDANHKETPTLFQP